jgi:glycosyltransferase involved in cell wall biosynthesis
MSVKEILLDPKLFLFSSFYGLLYRINLARNAAVVVQQNWLRVRFISQFNCQNVVVARPVRGAIKACTTHRGDIFIYPSYPRVFKNFETLLEAWAILQSDPTWVGELYITIDGSENRYTRSLLRRYGGLRGVHYVGLVDKSKVEHLYSAADCVVFPSKLETWGLPLSEAMDHGLAIIAADLPYAHETTRGYDGVAFFPPLDAEALALQMRNFSLGRLAFTPPAAVMAGPDELETWEALVERLVHYAKVRQQACNGEAGPLV